MTNGAAGVSLQDTAWREKRQLANPAPAIGRAIPGGTAASLRLRPAAIVANCLS